MTDSLVGVGNPLRGDDGIGPLLVERLQGLPCTKLVVGDDLTRLLDVWEGSGTSVVVDAVASFECPGKIHRWEWSEGLPKMVTERFSSHSLSLLDTIRLAEQLGRLPERLVLYGVEAVGFDLGTGLSGPVSEALGDLEGRVKAEFDF